MYARCKGKCMLVVKELYLNEHGYCKGCWEFYLRKEAAEIMFRLQKEGGDEAVS